MNEKWVCLYLSCIIRLRGDRSLLDKLILVKKEPSFYATVSELSLVINVLFSIH